MAHKVTPDTKANRALAKAISSKDGVTEKVQQALANGADPNIFLTSWMQSALGWAAIWKDPSVAQDLIKAGANAWHQHANAGGRPWYAGWDQRIRHHVELGEVFLEQFAQHLAAGDLDTKTLVSHLSYLTLDPAPYPLENHYRDLINQHGSTLVPKENWWLTAMEARSPWLMVYALEHKGMPDIKWVIRHTEAIVNLQSSEGLFPYIERLSDEQRLDFFLGTPQHQGILEATAGKLTNVRDPLWTYAANDPLIAEAMVTGEDATHFLDLAMRQHPSAAIGLLTQAKKNGVAVGDLLFDQTRKSPMGNQFDERFVKASLLDSHLNRHDRNISVKVMQQLLKDGCKPTYTTLSLASWHVTLSGGEKKMGALFEKFLDMGADPEPEGHEPVWDKLARHAANTKDPATVHFSRRIEAKFRQRLLDDRLPSEKPAQLTTKPRL